MCSPPPYVRHRLPDERPSRTFRLVYLGRPLDVTVSFYDEARTMPGEIFIDANHVGGDHPIMVELGPMLDVLAVTISVALQCGAPLDGLLHKFRGMRFAPDGWTRDPAVPHATSPIDYLARRLARSLGIGIDGTTPEVSAVEGAATVKAGPANKLLNRG